MTVWDFCHAHPLLTFFGMCCVAYFMCLVVHWLGTAHGNACRVRLEALQCKRATPPDRSKPPPPPAPPRKS